jgi:hypothetical protein
MRPILKTYACEVGNLLDQHVICVKGMSGCVDGRTVTVHLSKSDSPSELGLFFEDGQL